MPGFDQSGPRGEGPMTGGARGRCSRPVGGYSLTRLDNAVPGRGMAFRHGAGGSRGFGRRISRSAGTPVDELNSLRTEAELLKDSLQAINDRISQIEKRL